MMLPHSMLLLLAAVTLVSAGRWDNFKDNTTAPVARSARTRLTCDCGRQNRRRIINGRETLVNEYPLMANLMRMDVRRVFCGAAILTRRHALTAAHCTIHFPLNVTALNVGDHDITTPHETQNDIIPLAQIINHERYNINPKANDIAIVITVRDIIFGRHIGPACLPTEDLFLNFQTVRVLGWGTMENRGTQMADRLQQTDLHVMPIERCWEFYRRAVYTDYPHMQFCTFMRNTDSCQGDSGGPVLWFDKVHSRWILAGLVSFGRECDIGFPGVNTQVSTFIDWIRDRIRETFPSLSACKRVSV